MTAPQSGSLCRAVIRCLERKPRLAAQLDMCQRRVTQARKRRRRRRTPRYAGKIIFGPAMISAIEAAKLLLQATRLTPGDGLPGTTINPTVDSAYQRAQHEAGSIYVASHRLVAGPSLQDVAEHLGAPVWLPKTLGERELASAISVLRARMLDHATGEYLFAGRIQRVPVSESTLAEAVALVTAAITHKQQKAA
jgi:hypothetical protein